MDKQRCFSEAAAPSAMQATNRCRVCHDRIFISAAQTLAHLSRSTGPSRHASHWKKELHREQQIGMAEPFRGFAARSLMSLLGTLRPLICAIAVSVCCGAAPKNRQGKFEAETLEAEVSQDGHIAMHNSLKPSFKDPDTEFIELEEEEEEQEQEEEEGEDEKHDEDAEQESAGCRRRDCRRRFTCHRRSCRDGERILGGWRVQ
eukprot:g13787.t1